MVTFLRAVYWLALAMWLGGMVTLGAVVAPTVFGVVQAALPDGGRSLAGDVFGAALARFHYMAYGAAVAMLVSLAAMSLLGVSKRAYLVPIGVVTAMLLVALYSGVVVLNDARTLRVEIGGLASSLPPDDPRRARFDRLHQRSTQLMMVNIGCAMALVWWHAAHDRRRTNDA